MAQIFTNFWLKNSVYDKFRSNCDQNLVYSRQIISYGGYKTIGEEV